MLLDVRDATDDQQPGRADATVSVAAVAAARMAPRAPQAPATALRLRSSASRGRYTGSRAGRRRLHGPVRWRGPAADGSPARSGNTCVQSARPSHSRRSVAPSTERPRPVGSPRESLGRSRRAREELIVRGPVLGLEERIHRDVGDRLPPQFLDERILNRTGLLGDLMSWEDGVYGTSKSVFRERVRSG
jgi:hypothetical protein